MKLKLYFDLNEARREAQRLANRTREIVTLASYLDDDQRAYHLLATHHAPLPDVNQTGPAHNGEAYLPHGPVVLGRYATVADAAFAATLETAAVDVEIVECGGGAYEVHCYYAHSHRLDASRSGHSVLPQKPS